MSQRIVTECDGDHVEPADGHTVEIRALGYAIEVDLCEIHEKELRDLVEHLADIGRPFAGARRSSAASAAALSPAAQAMRQEPHTCPECGETYRGPQGLGAHRRAKHGVTGASAH